MKCPVCQNSTQVSNSRSADHGRAVKRRRVCLECNRRFTTYERIELFGLQVVKRSGEKQPYLRHKLELGLRKALEKRPVSEEQFQKLVSAVENDIFNLEKETVRSEEIGQIVLSHLRILDKVAYIRFVSVHRNFKSTKAFEKEIKKLEKK
ncbi:transcriptional repressor NrdR [Patescibacteria group bacterium]|nr:transcriptional repressor NrdR [Patescibacteria group bacterium]